MKDRNWWDTTVSYEDIVYDYMLIYESYAELSKETAIAFVADLMNVKVAELAEFLKDKYRENKHED